MVDEKLIRGGLRDELAELSGRELMHETVVPMERALARHLDTHHREDGHRRHPRDGPVVA
jgi:hypothetical protein